MAATTTNPILKPSDIVFIVFVSKTAKVPQRKTAQFVLGLISELDWDDEADEYQYNVTWETSEGLRNRWVKESLYNKDDGETITKTHNKAESAFRAVLDGIFT